MLQLREISRQMEEVLRTANIKLSSLAFVTAGTVALIVSLPSLRSYQAQMDKVRQEVSATQLKTDALERESEFEKAQAVIANERYKQCLPVVGEAYKNGTHYFAGLVALSVPTDRVTGKPFPPGTIVCDAHGVTAVIDAEGKVSFTAYTGDRDVVQKRLKRFKGSEYSQPVIGDK